MLLSVIIVNYNVRHFLEQCLHAVMIASKELEAEIFVVDNNSTDGSIAYLQPSFPSVTFISNTGNAGFARACNQGLRAASGRHILFLNPDTILPEDCLVKATGFLENNPDAGALGIKMVDGSGRFLKESKRSFPSPVTSFFKLSGLSRLFPRSSLFSRYHLGHLDPAQNHEVDVLAGAFMLVKKEVLEITGGFDETFFMYGEDVDLSYRIQKTINPKTGQHFKNFYFAESTIIHFKGESTRRGSLNYVRMFYNAMSIFVRKHYGGTRAGLFNFMIHVGIWVRAFLAGLGRFIRKIGLPLIDAGLILLSFWATKTWWSNYVRTDVQYDKRLLWIAIPAFTILYLIAAWYAGLYDRWYKRSELIRSTLVATIILLAGYSLLPEQFRFSRAIILFGAILSFILIGLLRRLLVATEVLSDNKHRQQHANTLIIGSEQEYREVMLLLESAGLEDKILGRVGVNDADTSTVGNWRRLEQLIKVLPFREVVFCEGTLSFKDIIATIEKAAGKIRFKIHASGSQSIVGSDSKDTAGEAFSKENGVKLSSPYYRRLKRLLDISIACAAIITFPVHFLLVKNRVRFFRNCFAVLSGKKTWVGYAGLATNLPPLRTGVISCNGVPGSRLQELPLQSLQMMDFWYARDFELLQDLKLIWKNYTRLGS